MLRTFLLTLAVSSVAAAQGLEVSQEIERRPWDHLFGLGAYATGWGGSYGAAGVGAAIRVEPFTFLGVDLFGEALWVESPAGFRHDHPIGFNLYVPFRLGRFRLRPLIGMCVTLSFIEPLERDAPRADDVLVGAHAGAALEFALARRVSLFATGKAVVWVGHDRTVMGWTGALDNTVQPFVVGQATLGLMVHLGER
jgi:hypothetical protein